MQEITLPPDVDRGFACFHIAMATLLEDPNWYCETTHTHMVACSNEAKTAGIAGGGMPLKYIGDVYALHDICIPETLKGFSGNPEYFTVVIEEDGIRYDYRIHRSAKCILNYQTGKKECKHHSLCLSYEAMRNLLEYITFDNVGVRWQDLIEA